MTTRRWKRRPEGSTWGDFGEDDQQGRMNLLTPEVVRGAISEVREGVTFCLSLPLDLPGGDSVNSKRKPPELRPVFVGDDVYSNYRWSERIPGNHDISSDEAVLLHSQYSTQWDSLAHIGAEFDADEDGVPEALYYNGYRAGEDIHSPYDGGARALSIDNMATACVQTRGVMIDARRHLGDSRTAIDMDGLQQIMDTDGIDVREGDMLCLHTGFATMIMEMAGNPDAAKLHSSCAVLNGRDDRLLRWISDTGIVAIASDNMAVEDSRGTGGAEDGGSRLPLHHHCLFKLGVHLGELWYFEDLAKALVDRKRNNFLITAPPLRLPGAVGSPVTPVATI
tara:strand:- start:110087 stop:111097 length:1011 start_codon:yes stop_codon:yes gene_type:complete